MNETAHANAAGAVVGTGDQRLQCWNNTTILFPEDHRLHQLFARQVERSPKAIAAVYGDARLTYAELDARSNQLANYLRTRGVGPDVMVGVAMERSLDLGVALLAVLKAGGAYVPIDPNYPAQRIEFMLKDSAVPILLTQERLLHGIPAYDGEIFCVDRNWEKAANLPTTPPTDLTTPANLAYMIYTSGSTGKPKGAFNTHRAICNCMLWKQSAFRLTGEDAVIQKTPYSFDISLSELFWPILNGARIVYAKPKGHLDAAYLIDLIAKERVTIAQFVPSMLRLFLEQPRVKDCTTLRAVLALGEVLPPGAVEQFFSLLSSDLYNLYGPTEAAVEVTSYRCDRRQKLVTVPIGKPIANTQTWILDPSLNPVPIGEVGELYIGGVQVGRGYHNRPELTAERFIPDPFSPDAEARLYKTGDLARYLEDGNIDYLGRVDFQVKIRGHRIELGELEAHLAEYPVVKQAVVTASEQHGENRLAAYLAVNGSAHPNVSDLQQFLLKRVPEYMVPAHYICLSSFPLLPNGKVDRSALPAPGRQRPALAQGYIPPHGELECALARMWEEILGLENIGAMDRFFELGGSSLQAASFINRVQKLLGEPMFIVALFDSPTIAQFAQFLRKQYPAPVAAKFPSEKTEETVKNDRKVDAEMLSYFRQVIPLLPKSGAQTEAKNPPAIFVLAPPRSGTTLLRVMLAGHPRLFAAAELQLLCFHSLAERRQAMSGKFALWLEGTLRALMDIKGCDAAQARQLMEDHAGLTTQQFYRKLQSWISPRTLVDKSPGYALDPGALCKAETDFDQPLYIHLVRHPYAAVRSFEEYHLDQVLYLREHAFTPRHLGEMVWTTSHQNILHFLRDVPAERQFRMSFEALTQTPEPVMRDMCQRFGIEFHPELLQPYKDKEKKMTDGLYGASRPMGDTKFHQHKRIDARVAESWKNVENDNFLGDVTWNVAEQLGYSRPEPNQGAQQRKSTILQQRQLRAKHRQS